MRGKKGGYGRTHSEVSVPSVKKKSSFVEQGNPIFSKIFDFFTLFFLEGEGEGKGLGRHDGWLDRKRETEEDRERRRGKGSDG